MSDHTPATPPRWECVPCGVALEPADVRVDYLGGAYPVELLRCPRCRSVLITEDLALGKMADVEKALEDK
jgi:hypothetical protein